MNSQPTQVYFAHGQNSHQWSTFQHPSGDSCLFRSGALHLTTTGQTLTSQLTTCVLQNVNAADLAFQADMTFVQMQSTDIVEAGLIVRFNQNTGDGYAFYLDTALYQSNFRPLVLGNSHLYDQVREAPSAHQGLHASNTLTIIVRKDMFYLYINGTSVDTEQDTQFQFGQFGLYLLSSQPAGIAFQNVKVWLI